MNGWFLWELVGKYTSDMDAWWDTYWTVLMVSLDITFISDMINSPWKNKLRIDRDLGPWRAHQILDGWQGLTQPMANLYKLLETTY